MSNGLICIAETIACEIVKKTGLSQCLGKTVCIWLRLFGYVWVLVFFFCLVPAWQYPLIRIAVGQYLLTF